MLLKRLPCLYRGFFQLMMKEIFQSMQAGACAKRRELFFDLSSIHTRQVLVLRRFVFGRKRNL